MTSPAALTCSKPTIHELEFHGSRAAGVRIFLVAAEPAHLANPLGGNKSLKLAPWLQTVTREGHKGLIGVGGAWSNFILSLALASRKAGVASVGIIRGAEHQLPATCTHNQKKTQERSSLQSMAMLRDATLAGMQLHFVSRAEFKRRAEPDWQQQWKALYPEYLYVPEGGSSVEAARSCRSLMPENFQATHWVVAAGTGATAAGLAAAIPHGSKLLVVNISGDPALQERVKRWRSELRISESESDDAGPIEFPAHKLPRFGKLTAVNCELANACYEQTGVLLDPVYTIKAMQQVQWMLQAGEFPPGARIALVHTGGLQGWRGYLQRYSRYLSQDVLHHIESLYPENSAV